MSKLVTTAVFVLVCMSSASAEPIGAIGSRSAHDEHAREEAQEHEHQSRHGGYFGDADDLYHYEALFNAKRQLVLYVNDDLNRPLDVRPLQGQWRLDPDEPSQVSGTFRPSADGAFFLTTLPPFHTDPVHVEVAVLKGTAWARMEFSLPAPRN